MSAQAVRVRVPAKTNLHLGVGAVRPDGFHELVTVFHAVDIVDEVSVARAERTTLRNRGEAARLLPTDSRNLAWRAADLLARYRELPAADAAVAIEVTKRIPVAGGMAGGSADAAATLVACDALWQTQLSTQELAALAAQLGSDVAFPLIGGTALGHGRGERLLPLPCAGRLQWVFAPAGYGVSAGAAYRELDRLRAEGQAPAPLGPPDALIDAVAAGDVAAVAAALGNDLQAATLALAPALAATLRAGTDRGALAGLVSGSGPTVAFLCSDADHAAGLAAALTGDGIVARAWATSGPVAGAQVSSDEPVAR